jgi:hypothetical protein
MRNRLKIKRNKSNCSTGEKRVKAEGSLFASNPGKIESATERLNATQRTDSSNTPLESKIA